MTNKLSAALLELSNKAKALETKTQNAKQATQEKINIWEAEAKEKSEASKIAFKAKTEGLKSDVKLHWQEVQDNFNNRVAKAKSDVNDLKDFFKPDAETRANWAEDNAEMSICYALDALADAETAIAKAINTRLEADSL